MRSSTWRQVKKRYFSIVVLPEIYTALYYWVYGILFINQMCFRQYFEISPEANPCSAATLNPWRASRAPRHTGSAAREKVVAGKRARGVGCTLLYIKWAAQHSVSQHLCGFQHRRSSPWETLGASWSVFSDTTSDTLSVLQWITSRAHAWIFQWFSL